MISVKQRDGTTRTFLADDFWEQLFLLDVGAAVGERTPTAASLAMENATEEARAEIRALIEREGGDFLRAATRDGFSNIETEIPDLSETS
jgi:DNA-binding FadR family transcriptional regulator